MPNAEPSAERPVDEPVTGAAPQARKRPAPGERRMQILQTLAAMLQQPGAERVTTAALAARLQVSEAALYRHFASKAQMFEALIDFIEHSVFSLTRQIADREAHPTEKLAHAVTALLRFAEANPGLARVMAGDALVGEHERLQQRMGLFFDKLEAQWRQWAREPLNPDGAMPTVEAQVRAGVLLAFSLGRIHRFVRSGFRRLPTEVLPESLQVML
jgi:TetR/AcrR family transcriptional regulator